VRHVKEGRGGKDDNGNLVKEGEGLRSASGNPAVLNLIPKGE